MLYINLLKISDVGFYRFAFLVASRIQMGSSAAKSTVPWLQTTPRFGVIDNAPSRPVPKLLPAATVTREVAANNSSNDEMLQTQLKMNAEILQRLDALEAEKKTLVEEVKTVQAAFDMSNKANAVMKAELEQSLDECSKLREKLAKFKPVSKKEVFKNKENLNTVNEPNTSFN